MKMNMVVLGLERRESDPHLSRLDEAEKFFLDAGTSKTRSLVEVINAVCRDQAM